MLRLLPPHSLYRLLQVKLEGTDFLIELVEAVVSEAEALLLMIEARGKKQDARCRVVNTDKEQGEALMCAVSARSSVVLCVPVLSCLRQKCCLSLCCRFLCVASYVTSTCLCLTDAQHYCCSLVCAKVN